MRLYNQYVRIAITYDQSLVYEIRIKNSEINKRINYFHGSISQRNRELFKKYSIKNFIVCLMIGTLFSQGIF